MWQNLISHWLSKCSDKEEFLHDSFVTVSIQQKSLDNKNTRNMERSLLGNCIAFWTGLASTIISSEFLLNVRLFLLIHADLCWWNSIIYSKHTQMNISMASIHSKFMLHKPPLEIMLIKIFSIQWNIKLWGLVPLGMNHSPIKSLIY